ncbi:MAG: M14 family zinc carboxypeptidase [Candidatus Ornithomonoglobus sp.]
MKYDYEYISGKMTEFKTTFIIGKTIMNRFLYCISIGTGERCAVFAAAFHGLEYLTSPALISFAEYFSELTQYHDKIKVYIIPMINPDGVDIAVNGIDPKSVVHRHLIKEIGITEFSRVWQSNAMGVDINHNFNASWKSILNSPAPTKYGGRYPESELETRALTKFLSKTQPELFIAFHSQGKEIYYDFNGMENKRSEATAEAIADKCGYFAAVPTGTAAFGGAKDWYIQKYHKQAFTVELGKGTNPLPLSQLDEMSEDTIKICMTAISEVFK